jgi:hypothetical protein
MMEERNEERERERERERELTCSLDRNGLGFLGGVKIGSSPVNSSSKLLISSRDLCNQYTTT